MNKHYDQKLGQQVIKTNVSSASHIIRQKKGTYRSLIANFWDTIQISILILKHILILEFLFLSYS